MLDIDDFDYKQEKIDDLMQEYLIQLGEITEEDNNNHEKEIDYE